MLFPSLITICVLFVLRVFDTGDVCRGRRIPSKPEAVSRSVKNESASVTRRLVFFMGEETAPGFEGMRRRRHMSPVPNARLARFFTRGNCSRLRENFERMCRLLHMPSVFKPPCVIMQSTKGMVDNVHYSCRKFDESH